MEESSNERAEVTLKVQAHDEEKEVVLDDSPVRDIITDGNSKSANETPDGQEDSETVEEEKVVSDSVVESVELKPGVSLTQEFSQDTKPSVEKSGDSVVAEIDAKGTVENMSPSLKETNGDSPMLTDLLINSLKNETEQLFSAETTGDSALLTDVELKGVDKDTTLPGSDETDGSMVAADVVSGEIEETTISCLAENGGVPVAAKAQGITETKIPVSDIDAGGSSGSPELSSKENVEDSLQAENAPIVETRDAGEQANELAVQESTGNQPFISPNHRPLQPTSWKSCCGLFEVLRRSER